MFHVNHIHLKAVDPRKTAQWYVDVFGAKVLGEGPGLGDSLGIRLDIEGTRINVTSAPAGETLSPGTSDSHYGLEHYGFDTDDIEKAMEHVVSHGAEVLLPITQMGSGSRISYIKGPDDVRIELVQPAS